MKEYLFSYPDIAARTYATCRKKHAHCWRHQYRTVRYKEPPAHFRTTISRHRQCARQSSGSCLSYNDSGIRCLRFRNCAKGTPSSFLSFLLERLSENTINARSKVTSRAHCRLPPDRIAHTRQRCVVVGVHILKDRNKLVAQADVECRILRLQTHMQGFRRVAKYVERGLNGVKTMLARTLRLEIVCSVSAKRQQFIIIRLYRVPHEYSHPAYRTRMSYHAGILHLKITEDAYIVQALLHAGLAIKAVKALHGASAEIPVLSCT